MKGYISEGVPQWKRVLYQQWIDEHVPDKCKNLCCLKAREMHEVFGLIVFVDYSGLDRGHCWCQDEVGNIVDPTAHQSPLPYPYECGHEATFKDMNACQKCGVVTDDKMFCSQKCSDDFVQELQNATS